MNARSFFEYVIAQDEDKLQEYFSENAVVRWMCTGEEFTAQEYIKVNCMYPNSWDGEIERIVTVDDSVIIAARVFAKEGTESFHVVSFIKLRDGLISEMDEYWAEDGDVPQWRADLKIGKHL